MLESLPEKSPKQTMQILSAGTVLGFDYGLKRIGVAVGDLMLNLAHPLETIASDVVAIRFARIGELVAEWKPVLAVVGMPAHDDGREHAFAGSCLRFGRRLHGRFGLSVLWVDERYSSTAASMALHEAGVRGRQQKSSLDQMAAQQILQLYLDDRNCGHDIT